MAWCGTKKANRLLKLDKSSVLVFDLETTGLLVSRPEILQISLVDGNGRVLFSSYIKPERHKTWPNAEKINGISPEMVANAPRLAEVRGQIQHYFNRAKLIAGYNIKGFDIPVIESHGIVVPANRFDVMEEFRLFTGRISGIKLKDCANYFGFGFSPHDATQDACTTAYCMRALINAPGFVNTAPPKPRNTEKIADKSAESEQRTNGIPVKAKLMKPLLKKRQFHPLIVGVFLLVLSLLWLYYQTYGAHITTIVIQQLVDTALINGTKKIIGTLLIIGLVFFLIGIIRLVVKAGQWIVNTLHYLLSGQ